MPLCVFAQNSRITLSDNTTIYGTVVGMNNGVYVIKTETMGELNIDAENVVSISSLKNNPKSADNLSQIKIIEESDKSQRSRKILSQIIRVIIAVLCKNKQHESAIYDHGQQFFRFTYEFERKFNDDRYHERPEIMDAISRGDYEF
jgi:hypothetical protein